MRSVPVARTDYSVAVGYLRAFATVLVIEHHSFLGYVSVLPEQARFGDPSGPWQAFPIVDPNRWIGFDLPVIWNDIALMSLIRGLFITCSRFLIACDPFSVFPLWDCYCSLLPGALLRHPC